MEGWLSILLTHFVKLYISCQNSAEISDFFPSSITLDKEVGAIFGDA